jgi:hypothetical protein
MAIAKRVTGPMGCNDPRDRNVNRGIGGSMMLNRPLKIWQALLLAGVLMAVALAVTGAHGQGSPRVEIVGNSVTVPAHSVAFGRVKCDRPNLALGGGVSVQDASLQDVRSTYPWDDSDDNPRPDDGWAGQIHNDGNEELSATIFAACG